jgi:hypothetical protein
MARVKFLEKDILSVALAYIMVAAMIGVSFVVLS